MGRKACLLKMADQSVCREEELCVVSVWERLTAYIDDRRSDSLTD